MGKDGGECEMIKTAQSKSFWATLVRNGVEQPKLGILNDFVPLW